MLSNVTLNCQVANIVMNSGSQLSELQLVSQKSQVSGAGTVRSKCSSTGSACPVAIGHRDSIQQEMLKRYLSDLLGEPCLFASVVPLPGSVLECYDHG